MTLPRGRRPRRYPPLSRVNYDERGLAASLGIYVLPCASEPLSTIVTAHPCVHGTNVSDVARRSKVSSGSPAQGST